MFIEITNIANSEKILINFASIIKVKGTTNAIIETTDEIITATVDYNTVKSAIETFSTITDLLGNPL
jgi:hypothetical protein